MVIRRKIKGREGGGKRVRKRERREKDESKIKQM